MQAKSKKLTAKKSVKPPNYPHDFKSTSSSQVATPPAVGAKLNPKSSAAATATGRSSMGPHLAAKPLVHTMPTGMKGYGR